MSCGVPLPPVARSRSWRPAAKPNRPKPLAQDCSPVAGRAPVHRRGNRRSRIAGPAGLSRPGVGTPHAGKTPERRSAGVRLAVCARRPDPDSWFAIPCRCRIGAGPQLERTGYLCCRIDLLRVQFSDDPGRRRRRITAIQRRNAGKIFRHLDAPADTAACMVSDVFVALINQHGLRQYPFEGGDYLRIEMATRVAP